MEFRRSIRFNLFGDALNVQAISGKYSDSCEVTQIATYTITGGIADVIKLEPYIATVLKIPLPLRVLVTDYGSGNIVQIDFDCNNLIALPTTAMSNLWAERRLLQTPPEGHVYVLADYIGLL